AACGRDACRRSERRTRRSPRPGTAAAGESRDQSPLRFVTRTAGAAATLPARTEPPRLPRGHASHRVRRLVARHLREGAGGALCRRGGGQRTCAAAAADSVCRLCGVAAPAARRSRRAAAVRLLEATAARPARGCALACRLPEESGDHVARRLRDPAGL